MISNSSESQEASEAAVVRAPPPRADVNYSAVCALSLSLLQQAAAAAALINKSTKQEANLIDCIPGFEVVRFMLIQHRLFVSCDVFKVRASGFVEEGRGIDSECGSDSEGGKDGACLDTSDDEELVVKVSRS